jgi:hypothetical protein
VTRVPLLYDTRLVVAEAGDEDVVLRPHAPREVLDDVAQAVRDALAFPLAGEPLDRLVTRGGTATVVIEQPSLPIPAATTGPRNVAIATVADELERLGVQTTTILVAGGLMRRTTPREIGLLVPPEFRRRFRGRVVVHDAEADDLVDLGETGNVGLRIHPALVETDLVVVVTAAESVVHGGPGALLAAVAARDERVAGLAAGRVDRAAAPAARPRHRRVARPEHADGDGPLRRLPVRRRRRRAHRRLEHAAVLPARAVEAAAADARTAAA